MQHKGPLTRHTIVPELLAALRSVVDEALQEPDAREDLLVDTCRAIDIYRDNLSNPAAGVFPFDKVKRELLEIRKSALHITSVIGGMSEHASVLMGYGANAARGVRAPDEFAVRPQDANLDASDLEDLLTPDQFAVRPPDAPVDGEDPVVRLTKAFVRPRDLSGAEVPLLTGEGNQLTRALPPDDDEFVEIAHRATVAMTKLKHLRKRGAPRDRAARQLGFHVGRLWSRSGIPFARRSTRSLWFRFVRAAFGAAGVNKSGERIAREVALWFAQVSSTEIAAGDPRKP